MSTTARERTKTSAVAQCQAVLYARVSSKDQEREGYSIPAQARLLREYATTHQLAILEEFVDVETAKTTGRHGFTSMLVFLKRHPACRTVLVEKTDRLYRNLKDWVTIDEHDLEIHFVKENLVHSQDSRSSEKFLHGIKVLMAKNYIDNLGEEASKGMLEKARSGLWPSYAPLGYRNTLRADGKRIITPDPFIGPIVTRLFDLFAAGSYSLRTLATKAQEDGLSYRKSGQRMPPNTLQKLLRKRIYTGDFDFNGVTYHGTHEPLTTRATWERVQEILDARNRQPRRLTHQFPYNGLVRCGHCGCSLVGETKRKPSGKTYTYYHCTGYRGRCPEPYTPAAKLEDEFLSALRSLFIPQEIADWLTTILQETSADEEREQERTRLRLTSEAARLQARIDAMYVDKLDGTITAAFFEEKAREWRAEQARLQRQIATIQRDDKNAPEDTLRMLELAQCAATLFPMQPPSEQRTLLTLLVERATWKHGQLTVEFRRPLKDLRRAAARP